MRHLQTYELTKAEHKSMAAEPFLLILPPSPHPQEITLTVAGRRNGVERKSAESLSCSECGATANVAGKPFTAQGLATHRFKKHGILKSGSKSKRKAGAK